MAIFSYSVGERVSRGSGGSTVRCAAYLARECYKDQRTGWVHDFRQQRKSPTMEASDHIAREGRHAELGSRQEVLFSGLFAPANAPEWCVGAHNIARFWNAAEAAEKRKDAQIAERIIIALPKEFSVEEARWALQDHIRQFTRQGRVVQVAIHSPEPGLLHDERNLHAHLLVSLRGVDENGLKARKTEDQQMRYLYRSQYVEGLRENWAKIANRHLLRHGHKETIDHRSYVRQGIDHEPTIHLGPGDSWREGKGQRTAAGDHNREVEARNVERQRQAADRAIAEHERKRQLAELSERYQEKAKILGELTKRIEKLEGLVDWLGGKRAEAERNQANIRAGLSMPRRVLHDAGVWPYPELKAAEDNRRRAEYATNNAQREIMSRAPEERILRRQTEDILAQIKAKNVRQAPVVRVSSSEIPRHQEVPRQEQRQEQRQRARLRL